MTPSPIHRFLDFRLDPIRRKLCRAEEEIELAGKPMDLLITLVSGRGRILERDELLEIVWPGVVVEEANLTQSVSVLRKALGEGPGENRIIATIRGRGYRFVAELIDDPERLESGLPESASVSRRIAPAWIATAALGLLAFVFWLLVSQSVVRRPDPPPLERGALAVLPALNGSMDEPSDERGLALTDQVISGLVTHGLNVRPTRDVLEFRDPKRDTPSEAGRSLGVEYVVSIAIFERRQGSCASLQVISAQEGSIRGMRRIDLPEALEEQSRPLVDIILEILDAKQSSESIRQTDHHQRPGM